MSLLKECIDALGKNAFVLSKNETIEILESMLAQLPITTWGRIDWNKIKKAKQISSIDEITQCLNDTEDKVYILWDEATLPSIKTNLGTILNVIDDVTAVSFDTWIYSPTKRYVIEFYHAGEVTLGFF